MYQTREPKKKGIRFTLSPRKHGVQLPIGVQVQQAAIASAHRNDKRRTRNKAKAWKQEEGA
jgi:hypothetical protein